jgi:chromosome segregation ATPase
MKPKPRRDSKQSADVAALKQKLVRAKVHAEETKAAARKVKVDFKQLRKAYKHARKAAKQAKKAVKALTQEIKARTPRKIRRPSKARPAGAKATAGKTPAKSAVPSVPIARVNLGVTDGPVESALPVAPNASPTTPA